MAVFDSVEAELDRLGCVGWQREMALGMARSLDDEMSASMSAQLRVLMREIGASAKPQQVSHLDELKRRRDERKRRLASGS